MRIWNGWGDDSVRFELPRAAVEYLEERLGPGRPSRDAAFEAVVSGVPRSRLPEHPLISTNPDDRVRHCAGQSFSDWVALRTGSVSAFPDGVAFPLTTGQVGRILAFARDTGAKVIPYGGGTSVVGHLTAPRGPAPVITLSLTGCSRMTELDEPGCLATFEAGVSGPDLETALNQRGFTLGHFPQSFEYSTLGGWVATRSSGHFSIGYGRIDNLLAGGEVETPAGRLILPPHPASAAGPDLRHLILGSEGRIGVITKCTVRISPRPEAQVFKGAFFSGPEDGLAAVRELAQAQLGLTMIRLSLPEETETNLVLAGDQRGVGLLRKLLAVRGFGESKCALIYGACGQDQQVRTAMRSAGEVIKKHRGIRLGSRPGAAWHKNRFLFPYARNLLWEMGYGADTLETAVRWRDVTATAAAIESTLKKAAEAFGEKIHAFTHLSHVYPHGSSIYTSYIFRLGREPAATLDLWRAMKRAASKAIIEKGGTISHHHGVGLDHAPYLEFEKGSLGLRVLRSALKAFDPEGIMNPGKLIGD